MTSPVDRFPALRFPVRAGALCAAILLAGCGGSESSSSQNAPQQAAPPPRAYEPPPPASSLAGVKLHPKVQFPRERLPSTQEATDAVAAFASALAGGDHAAFGAMLAPLDRAVLNPLVASGEWRRLTDGIKVVRVCVISEPSAAAIQVGLGIEDADGAFLSAWEGTPGTGGYLFTAMAVEPKTASKASDLDGAALNIREAPKVEPPKVSEITPPAPKPEDTPEEEEAPASSDPPPFGLPPGGDPF